jgi:hypothetical protein
MTIPTSEEAAYQNTGTDVSLGLIYFFVSLLLAVMYIPVYDIHATHADCERLSRGQE